MTTAHRIAIYRRRCRGMTLLEVLVAIAIFAVVAGAGYVGLDQGLAFEKRLKTDRELWRRLDAAYTLMQTDLAFAQPHALRFANGRTLAFSGRVARAAAPREALFSFTRDAPTLMRAAHAGPYQQIAYRWVNGDLLRTVHAQGSSTAGAADLGSTLLEDVSEVHVRYLLAGNQWTYAWPESANPQDPTVLPRAVEFVFTLEGHAPIKWLFHVGTPL